MRRETSNRIRFAIEELVPGIIRDSRPFAFLLRLAGGTHVEALAEFRRRAPFLTADEYRALYASHPRVHDDTDLSAACVELIGRSAIGPEICDVGCGTGHLIRVLAAAPTLKDCRFTGIDFVLDKAVAGPNIAFRECNIARMPFPDRAFDTVVCTHVLEHILDLRAALTELRRVARRRLILVVPREREFEYNFNPHFHFFPYPHSFLKMLFPIPDRHQIRQIGRDFFYTEDMETGGAAA
ncbi:MAG TPA: class I SAM-dependent methyltransferase [Dongiaceae bacterium]|nr:class I SAM-dependent methyltransferase [Dongiaceae bacterium]